jgi:hypothetical protein
MSTTSVEPARRVSSDLTADDDGPGVRSDSAAGDEKDAAALEPESQPKSTDEPKSVVYVPYRLRRLLAVTMAIQCPLLLVMTVRDFTLTKTPVATIGSATLLAILAVTIWATCAAWCHSDGWLATSALSQFAVVVLAGYIVLIDLRSPFPQFLGITGFAFIIGIIAASWLLYLARHRYLHGGITNGLKAIAALIPLIGFIQFWMQTDYLPRTSLPLVDLTAALTSTGKTGDTVHLEATVTLNNRGSVPVNIGGTLMRITAYERTTGTPDHVADAIEFGLNPEHEYRDDPLPTSRKELLYANDVLQAGSILAPGQSHTFRRVVDFNSSTRRLARLAVDAIFITSPRISEVYTCGPSKKATGDSGFQEEIAKALEENGARFLCRDIHLSPRNVIHEMVADHPAFAVQAILDDDNPPRKNLDYPRLVMWRGASGNYNLNSMQDQKVDDANPTMTYQDMVVEYSPSDEPAASTKK